MLIVKPTVLDFSYAAVMPQGNFLVFIIDFVYSFTKLWGALILICGILLLKVKNIGRITFIVLCGISFLIKFVSLVLEFKESIFNFWSILGIIIPIVYIFYLTRPKVKEQFR